MPTLNLLLIAADPLARAGLAALLADQPGIAVAGQTGPGDGLDAALAAFLPDVVIWDLGWEPASQLEALNDFAEDAPPVLALLQTPAAAGTARAAGARGILSRATNGPQLAAAAQAVAQGLFVFDAAWAEESIPGALPILPLAPDAAGEPLVEALSARELEVLRGLAEGLSNKLIARQLAISEHTVKFHVNQILGKLGAQSRTEAVVRATRAGMILL